MSSYNKPLVLWRAWKVENNQLQSPLWNHGIWHPGMQIAQCQKGHKAPQKQCGCGIYGYYKPENSLLPSSEIRTKLLSDSIEDLYALAEKTNTTLSQVYFWKARQKMRLSAEPGFFVDGAILAWGKIELHQKGARVQYAKPLALTVDGLPASTAQSLKEKYKVFLFEDSSALWKVSSEFGWQMDDSSHFLKESVENQRRN